MKVLLVDDDDLLRNFLKKVLTKAGVAVVEASNGKDALGLSQDVDVLVTDIVMDGIDGLCLAESVQTYRVRMPCSRPALQLCVRKAVKSCRYSAPCWAAERSGRVADIMTSA